MNIHCHSQITLVQLPYLDHSSRRSNPFPFHHYHLMQEHKIHECVCVCKEETYILLIYYFCQQASRATNITTNTRETILNLAGQKRKNWISWMSTAIKPCFSTYPHPNWGIPHPFYAVYICMCSWSAQHNIFMLRILFLFRAGLCFLCVSFFFQLFFLYFAKQLIFTVSEKNKKQTERSEQKRVALPLTNFVGFVER